MSRNPPISAKTTIEIRCETKTGSKFDFWKDLKIGDRIEITIDISKWYPLYHLKNLRNNLEFTHDSLTRLRNQLNNWDYINV